MTDENPQEPGQPQLTPREPTLLPPPSYAPMGPPPSWAPPQPPPPTSVWSRIAAYVVLIAVVAAAAGAGIGWSLARAVNTHQIADHAGHARHGFLQRERRRDRGEGEPRHR